MEYKFLKRALDDDPQVDLVGSIRIAKREPKFVFKGRDGESSNPLFRGFRGDEEEEGSYDKPILKRLNVKSEDELLMASVSRAIFLVNTRSSSTTWNRRFSCQTSGS